MIEVKAWTERDYPRRPTYAQLGEVAKLFGTGFHFGMKPTDTLASDEVLRRFVGIVRARVLREAAEIAAGSDECCHCGSSALLAAADRAELGEQ